MYGSGSSVGLDNKNIQTGTGRAVIGLAGDLSNHHPIGFDYTQVQSPVDDEIRVTTDAGFLTDPTDGTKAGGPKTISDLLWNKNVECVSCHDVHNTKNGGTRLTWVTDKQSKLCFTCHNKDQVARP
jgi:predicted CXXCH cytochrome family protein